MTSAAPAVEAVLLDAAGTLFEEREGRAQLYAQALARHGCPRPVAQVGLWMAAAHEALDEPTPRYGEAWFDAFVAHVLAAAGCRADPSRVRRELGEVFLDATTYRVFDDVLPTLSRLSASGLRLAVVSNWSEALPVLLERLQLAAWFEVLSVSAVLAVDKPAPELFQHALDTLGVSATGAVHVGDHPRNDLGGARAAGIDAWLIDRERRHLHEARRLDRLTELADKLGA